MNLTQIIHYESARDASRRTDVEHFVIMHPSGDVDDHENAHVYVGFTSRLLTSLGIEREKSLSLLMRAALDALRGMVRDDEIESGKSYEVMFTVDAPLDVGMFEWKLCAYQQPSETGLRCAAAHSRDFARGVTTKALCEACELPSTDILCDELSHPVVTGNEESPQLTARHFVDSKCNIGSSRFKTGVDCVPQGNSCWRKTIPVPAESTARPADEIVDLVDRLNDVFERNYGVPFIRLFRAQTIQTITSRGTGEEAYESKLQALGRLLEHIQGQGLAASASVEVLQQGSITHLEAFLQSQSLQDIPLIIRPLRDVMTVRVHGSHDRTRQDVTGAFGRLRISRPIADFDEAWEKLARAVVVAFRTLLRSVP